MRGEKTLRISDLSKDELIVLVSQNLCCKESILVRAKYETALRKAEMYEDEATGAFEKYLKHLEGAKVAFETQEHMAAMEEAIDCLKRYEAMNVRAEKERMRADRLRKQWEAAIQREAAEKYH